MASTSRSEHREAHTSTALEPYGQKVELNDSQSKKCMLCGHKDISRQLNGPLYMLNDVVVHYFCIMLSSKSVKKGTDKEGVWGYLLNDIRAEITRGSTLTCVYCKMKGATLSCAEVKCGKLFHLPCGLINGTMHHFFPPNNSYCPLHHVQPVVDVFELPPFANPSVDCGVCEKNVEPSILSNVIWVPCCGSNAWFHKKCIQELAMRKGYFIDCPNCGNNDKFKSRIITLGIYIPSLYATWEERRSRQNQILKSLHINHKEIPERVLQCNAKRCLCPHEGTRTYQNEFAWKLVLCRTCGSRQTHMYCNSIRFEEKWNCAECQMAITNVPRRRLEHPTHGNSVGLSAVLGYLDSNGNPIPKQPYIPGYVKLRE